MFDWLNYNNVIQHHEAPLNSFPLVRHYEAESVVADTSITVDTIKQYLRLPLTVTQDDVFLASLRDTAISMFETATGVTVLLTDWLTYRDDFDTRQFLLRKRKYYSFTELTYTNTDGDVKTINADNYYITSEYPFSRIILKSDKDWGDENIAKQKQAIKIRFRAGLSDENGIYPADVVTALLSMIAFMYVNRGDCQTSDFATMTMPQIANAVIAKYRAVYLGNTNYLEDKHGVRD